MLGRYRDPPAPMIIPRSPHRPSRARAVAAEVEPDITPGWVDALLCALGALMFLSNLATLAQL